VNNPWRVWGAAFVLLTVIELANITQAHLSGILRVPITPWLVFNDLIYWYSWAAVSPLVVLVARRYRFEERPLKSLAAHVPTALAVFALAGLLRTLVRWPIFGLRTSFAETWRLSFVSSLTNFLMLYVATVMLFYALDYYRAYHARTLRASQLETEVVRAQLDALRRQLQPHFLFNALHAISALMTRDVPAARKMIAKLSDLLRLTLDESEQHEVPLAQELAFLEQYLDLQRMRFGDRLRVEQRVEPGTLDCLVPRLVLQPIVENALRHGIEQRAAAGRVSIDAERADGMLRLRVCDDGPGLAALVESTALVEGIGLRNTRARLQHLYGGAASLDLVDNTGGGLCVVMRLPASEFARVARQDTDA
jgi:sensor histidine kinase YesM